MENKITITIADGRKIQAVCPIIVSASRSTDIPAFYADWFFERLRRGYVAWVNPFNQKTMYVSFEKTRMIVFWTKNPEPIIPYLDELERLNIHYYFQFTLNDYVDEKLEPGVPPLEKRIGTFKQIADRIGKKRVIWRLDPLMLSESLTVASLLKKAMRIGNELHNYTDKMVFSFADISPYRKVQRNLKDTLYREFNDDERFQWAKGLTEINNSWNLQLATCAEEMALEKYGIIHNKCIDDDLMMRLFPEDKVLMDFIGATPSLLSASGMEIQKSKKDSGQRKACGCIVSKDIGEYNTCPHLCSYCYANSSRETVLRNWAAHKANPLSDRIVERSTNSES